MPKFIEGKLDAGKLRFGIVVSRFNEFMSEKLLQGCLDCLQRHNADDSKVTVVRVPGSFEIPLAAGKLASSGKVDAVIALGVLVRGGTSHFDLIATQAVKGISESALKTGIPVALGIVTADSIEQAIERAGSKMGNKGWDAALSAIEMCRVIQQIDGK
ncbi:6,7-dimethyl-8-ribityllumazine synthase [Acidobacteriota bacterium]